MLYFPPWQKIAIVAICLLGFLFALPNVWYQRADTAARAEAAIEAGRYGGEGQPGHSRRPGLCRRRRVHCATLSAGGGGTQPTPRRLALAT